MEHQVQGMVFQDGEWVSRRSDVYRIMARTQQQADTDMREPESKPQNKVPKLGILSRTVFASPFIKFVLSANIRHKKLNDVVFVSEDAVHLKEIQAYGHLRHAGSKSDFSGRILTARVFGEPRQVQVHAEHGKPWNKAAVHAERKSFSGDDANAFPPEVIVLTLSSRTLMFLWASKAQAGRVSFHQRVFRLPAGTSRHDRLGAFLAIDPKCRAIAVAAPEGRFMLYKTKPIATWRENAHEGQDVVPIEDERLIHLQGRIMHMEFLSRTKDEDESHVVLLFILAHNGKTKITCYDWDCRYNLSTASVRAERVAVDPEDHNPTLLIPLSQSSDFLLVCSLHVTLYRKVLSGTPQRHRSKIPNFILPSRRPGDSPDAPLWVQWDQVPRNPTFSKEAFYIAREDGMIIYSEINDASNSVETSEAGIWPYPIDKAFATLDVDTSAMALSYPDVLIAPGIASDGLLCKVGAYPTQYVHTKPFPVAHAFSFVESIPNWVPIADLAVTQVRGAPSLHDRERDAIFIANGRAPHGTISELRRGLNAVVDTTSWGYIGCTGLWVIDHGSKTLQIDGKSAKEHYTVLLIALPLETMVVRVHREQKESGSVESGSWSDWEEGVWKIPEKDDSIQDDIMRDDETISACLLDKYFAIQVTRKEARLLPRPNLSGVSSSSFSSRSFDGNTHLLAAATESNTYWLAIVFREGNSKIILQVIPIKDGAFGDSIHHQLDADPTCLELLSIDGIPHVFVGKADSSFTLFKIEESGTLLLVYDDVMDQGPTTGLRMVCESSALLKSGQEPVVICGTRNGFLLGLFLRVTDNRYDLLAKKYIKMGTTAAQVKKSATDPSAAFVTCGSDTCRVRCVLDRMHAIEVDSIWFTKGETPEYKQCSITAIDQLPFSKSLGIEKDLGGFIFAVAGDSLLFAQLDFDMRWSSYDFPPSTLEQQKALPRKLITDAAPTKLMYLEKLNKMVVATLEAKEERKPPGGYRAMHSAIQLLRLNNGDEAEMNQEDGSDIPNNNLVASEFILKHYERVYSMIEWTFVKDTDKVFHFLIVGTGITSGGREFGRRLFLNVNETGIRQKKESSYEHPVRCMGLFDDNQLISIVGSKLIFEEYEHQAAKWVRRGQKELTSTGTHLTVSRPFVYVSTAADSHICYEVISLGELVNFSQVFTDSRQRNSAHHLVVSLHLPIDTPSSTPRERLDDSLPSASPIPPDVPSQTTIVLLTDKACNVTGLFHPPQHTQKSATDTLFEACLPRSITRLQRGSIRPPWRRPCYDYASPFPPPIPGVLIDDIIGTTTDGAVYTFSILSHPALLLLRLLQNLIEAKKIRDPRNKVQTIKMRSGDIFNVLMNGREGEQDSEVGVRDVDPNLGERGPAGTRGKAVDGDLIWRWFEDGGSMKVLVNEEAEKEVGVLFEELVGDVKAEAIGREAGGVDTGGEESVEWTERWVRDVLMPVL